MNMSKANDHSTLQNLHELSEWI